MCSWGLEGPSFPGFPGVQVLPLSWILFSPSVPFLSLVPGVRLVSHLQLFSWMLLVWGTALVMGGGGRGVAGVLFTALVLGAAGFSGPTFALGATLP